MTAAEAMPVPENPKTTVGRTRGRRAGGKLLHLLRHLPYDLHARCHCFNLNMAFIALMTGAAYAVMTLVFGKISGGQFNPAVSIAAMLTGKTHVPTASFYHCPVAGRYRCRRGPPFSAADIRTGSF